MESMTTSQEKEIRESIGIKSNFQVIREFDLPQQFPSQLKLCKFKTVKIKNVGLKANAVTEHVPNATKSTVANKMVNVLPHKKVQVVNKVQKLRLKTRDGRDLGEFKVQLLACDNAVSSNKLAKSNVLNEVNKPVGFSILPSPDKKKYVSVFRLSRKDQSNTKGTVVSLKPVANGNTSHILKDLKPEINDATNKLSEGRNVVPLKPINLSEIKTEKIESIEPSLESATQIAGESRNNGSPKNGAAKNARERSTKTGAASCRKSSRITIRSRKRKYKRTKVLELIDSNKVIAKKEANAGLSTGKSSRHEKIIASTFPVVKCEKLPMVNDESSNSAKSIKSPEKVDTLRTSQQNGRVKSNRLTEERCTRKKVVADLANPRKKIHEDVHPRKRTGSSENRNNDVSNGKCLIVRNGEGVTCPLKDHNKVKLIENSRNVKHMIADQNRSSAMELSKNESGAQKNTSITNSKDVSSKACVDSTSSSSNDISNNTMPKNDSLETPAQKNMLHHLSIIEEAISTVTDVELRAKALKALADCGIGIERHVPVLPPEQTKAVKDTLMQTEVFGLLDPENFVLVKEELASISRINQVESTFPSTVISNMNATVQTQSIQNNLVGDDNTILGYSAPSSDIGLDLEEFLDMLSNDRGAKKIKETLSKPNPMPSMIVGQIQKDFEGITKRDEFGLLNIHRAVINNNLRDVQRLILCVKAAEESIDVPTEDGKTSLELAIQNDVSATIVKLLLDAGAQPVSPELAYDSAIILASEISSPLLSELLNYVKCRKLIDQVGSKGFAALHNCALNGYSEGVRRLLEAGANINLRDQRSGRTAFFHALENNHCSIAQLLLESNAIPDIPNFSGQTVLALVEDVKSLSLRTTLSRLIEKQRQQYQQN